MLERVCGLFLFAALDSFSGKISSLDKLSCGILSKNLLYLSCIEKGNPNDFINTLRG